MSDNTCLFTSQTKSTLEFGSLQSYSVLSCSVILHRIVSYRIVSYRVVSCRIVSYHIISYHIISYHIISYHIISYHISYDPGSGPFTPFIIHIQHIIAVFLLIKIYSFLETYIPKVDMAMLVYWMIWYCVVSGVLSVVCSSILYVMVWI